MTFVLYAFLPRPLISSLVTRAVLSTLVAFECTCYGSWWYQNDQYSNQNKWFHYYQARYPKEPCTAGNKDFLSLEHCFFLASPCKCRGILSPTAKYDRRRIGSCHRRLSEFIWRFPSGRFSRNTPLPSQIKRNGYSHHD